MGLFSKKKAPKPTPRQSLLLRSFNISEIQRRYQDEPVFRDLVRGIEAIIIQLPVDVEDVREAAMLIAAQKYEGA